MTHCDKAPEGWTCTRQANHDGSCAGWPTKTIPPTFRTEPHAPPGDDEFSDYDEGYKCGYDAGWQDALSSMPNSFFLGLTIGMVVMAGLMLLRNW